MKNIKIIFAFTAILAAGIANAQGEKCNVRQSGYNLEINGFDICVLDNTSRECFAIVNPCPEQ